jgi:hypothetical protein
MSGTILKRQEKNTFRNLRQKTVFAIAFVFLCYCKVDNIFDEPKHSLRNVLSFSIKAISFGEDLNVALTQNVFR